MLIFSEDTEKENGQAEGAKAFLAEIAQADALIISFAEHNGSYTAAYKNLFDWSSRIERKFIKINLLFTSLHPQVLGEQATC